MKKRIVSLLLALCLLAGLPVSYTHLTLPTNIRLQERERV